MPIDGARIQALGWRQGSVFTRDASQPLIAAQRTTYGVESFPIPDDARLILVSHSCDVVHEKGQEPRIELCPVVPVERLDGRFTGTGNPRRLHVELEIAGTTLPHELLASARFYCGRHVLEAGRPDPVARLPRNYLRNFVHWIAKRVRRAALPDAFNRRIDTRTRRQIARLLEPLQTNLYVLLIALDPLDQELDEGDEYRLQVLALMEPDEYLDTGKRAAVEAALVAIGRLLEGANDIDLEQCVVKSMADVSVAEYRDFVIWDLDELSLEEGDEPPQ